MITAGVDMGARTIKVVILKGGEVVGSAVGASGLEAVESARELMAAALSEAGAVRGEVTRVVATGTGREDAPDADAVMTEVSCAARGATHLFPRVRTVMDVGAEEGRVVRCNERGKVVDFAVNDKCAAGAGAFSEAVARALEVPLEELGPLSLRSTRTISMNAQCVVFAESEVVSMIHDNVPAEDMARAVHDAMASRIISMARRVGYSPPAALIGGLALNTGFVDALGRGLEDTSIQIPPRPELTAALGAALAAVDRAQRQ